jgi:uncharacterized protein
LIFEFKLRYTYLVARQIFVNLPVKDLEKTKEFFSKLGFTFNPQFTDEKAAAMVIEDGYSYYMLVTEPFYKSFIAKKEIADSSKTSEVINALSASSREEVDQMVDTAIAAGAIKYKETDDYGWMYSRSFQDLDGHLWEVLYMDLSKVPENPGESEKK